MTHNCPKPGKAKPKIYWSIWRQIHNCAVATVYHVKNCIERNTVDVMLWCALATAAKAMSMMIMWTLTTLTTLKIYHRFII